MQQKHTLFEAVLITYCHELSFDATATRLLIFTKGAYIWTWLHPFLVKIRLQCILPAPSYQSSQSIQLIFLGAYRKTSEKSLQNIANSTRQKPILPKKKRCSGWWSLFLIEFCRHVVILQQTPIRYAQSTGSSWHIHSTIKRRLWGSDEVLYIALIVTIKQACTSKRCPEVLYVCPSRASTHVDGANEIKICKTLSLWYAIGKQH